MSAIMPEWVDRRTAEWCAAICDHVAARVVAVMAPLEVRVGAEVCAKQIRAAITTLPAQAQEITE